MALTAGSKEARAVRWGPFTIASIASALTVIVLFPIWVVAAFVSAIVALVRSTREQSHAAAERTATIMSLALGCSVGPVVYLLLAAIVAVAD